MSRRNKELSFASKKRISVQDDEMSGMLIKLRVEVTNVN